MKQATPRRQREPGRTADLNYKYHTLSTGERAWPTTLTKKKGDNTNRPKSGAREVNKGTGRGRKGKKRALLWVRLTNLEHHVYLLRALQPGRRPGRCGAPEGTGCEWDKDKKSRPGLSLLVRPLFRCGLCLLCCFFSTRVKKIPQPSAVVPRKREKRTIS